MIKNFMMDIIMFSPLPFYSDLMSPELSGIR